MTCEVFNDLLLIYAAGECSDKTRKMVEEHVATCESCAKSLRAMTEPVGSGDARREKDTGDPGYPVGQSVTERLEEAAKEMTFKKGFKKIRRRWLISILCALLIIPLAGLGYLGYNETRGEGYAFSNIKGMSNVNSFMKCVQEGDYAGAVEYYDIESMYWELIREENKQAYKDLGVDQWAEMVREQYIRDMSGSVSYGMKVDSFSIGKPYRRKESWNPLFHPSDISPYTKEYWYVDVAICFWGENTENAKAPIEHYQVFTFKMDGDRVSTKETYAMINLRSFELADEDLFFFYSIALTPNAYVFNDDPNRYSKGPEGLPFHAWFAESPEFPQEN